MTDLTNAELADFIFNAIAHGDDKHRQWLRDKCDEIAPQIAARRLAAPKGEVSSEDELTTILRIGGTNFRRTAQRLLATGYCKRAAPDAVKAFAAELVRWCENEGGKLVSYEGGDVYRRVAVHIRSMVEAKEK